MDLYAPRRYIEASWPYRTQVGNRAFEVDVDEVRAFEEGTEATDDLTVMAIRYIGQS